MKESKGISISQTIGWHRNYHQKSLEKKNGPRGWIPWVNTCPQNFYRQIQKTFKYTQFKKFLLEVQNKHGNYSLDVNWYQMILQEQWKWGKGCFWLLSISFNIITLYFRFWRIFSVYSQPSLVLGMEVNSVMYNFLIISYVWNISTHFYNKNDNGYIDMNIET